MTSQNTWQGDEIINLPPNGTIQFDNSTTEYQNIWDWETFADDQLNIIDTHDRIPATTSPALEPASIAIDSELTNLAEFPISDHLTLDDISNVQSLCNIYSGYFDDSYYLNLDFPSPEMENPILESQGLKFISTSSKDPVESEPRPSSARGGRYTKKVIHDLNQVFDKDPYPDQIALDDLAVSTALSPRQIQTWFRNTRSRKSKRNHSSREECHGSQSESADPGPVASKSSTSMARGRTTERQEISTSTSRSSTSSALSQCSDAFISGRPRRGRKRSLQDSAEIHSAKRPQRDLDNAPQQDLKLNVIYQCTFCNKPLSKGAWRRHEETQHLPQRHWVCLGRGWRIQSPTEGIQQCVFCGESNPPDCHIETCHRIAECFARPQDEREFLRKDHLKQHLQNFHEADLPDTILTAWQCDINRSYITQSWECGFCGDILENWEARVEHVPKHFREGMDMSSWKSLQANKCKPLLDLNAIFRSRNDCHVTCQSLTIGAWTFFRFGTSSLAFCWDRTDGLITYIMPFKSGKFALQYSVGDIESISMNHVDKHPWYQDHEELMVVTLKKIPRFYYQTPDMTSPLQCQDFTEQNQASTFLVQRLVGFRHGGLREIMTDISMRLDAVVAAHASVAENSIATNPDILSDSDLSRFCPLCFMSYPKPCRTLSHNIYISCEDCGKKRSEDHECMPPPNRMSFTKIYCKGAFESGRRWGCDAGFTDHDSFSKHILETRCADSFITERRQTEADDLAELFRVNCSVNEHGTSQPTSSSSTTITVIRHPSPVPPAMRPTNPAPSFASDRLSEMDENWSIVRDFLQLAQMMQQAVEARSVDSLESLTSGPSFGEVWSDEP